MNTVSVSVIMANYNNALFIQDAIESVLNQTTDAWELVICDDASTDASLEVIGRFSHNNIRVIRNKQNIGYTRTLKRLLEHANNDVVAVLDSDDALVPETIERIIEAFNFLPTVGFVYSTFTYCDAKLNPVRKGYSRCIPPGKSNLHCDQISHIKSFRKSAYAKTSGYDEDIPYAEDKDITYKLEEVCPVLFIDANLYHYRVLPDSVSHAQTSWAIGITSHIRSITKAYNRRCQANSPNLTKPELIKRIQFLREEQKRKLDPDTLSDPGGFIVCHARQFMFVAIAKNALTTLKHLVLLYDYDLELGERDTNLHEILGYAMDGYSRISITDAKNSRYSNYVKFAVYRDPVERFLSLYVNKIMPESRSRHPQFVSAGIDGADLGKFIDFSRRELHKPVLLQDEHLRPQSQHYSSSDVDHIIDLKNLDAFLENTLNVPTQTPMNESRPEKPFITDAERREIKCLYQGDYKLQPDSSP